MLQRKKWMILLQQLVEVPRKTMSVWTDFAVRSFRSTLRKFFPIVGPLVSLVSHSSLLALLTCSVQLSLFVSLFHASTFPILVIQWFLVGYREISRAWLDFFSAHTSLLCESTCKENSCHSRNILRYATRKHSIAILAHAFLTRITGTRQTAYEEYITSTEYM